MVPRTECSITTPAGSASLTAASQCTTAIPKDQVAPEGQSRCSALRRRGDQGHRERHGHLLLVPRQQAVPPRSGCCRSCGRCRRIRSTRGEEAACPSGVRDEFLNGVRQIAHQRYPAGWPGCPRKPTFATGVAVERSTPPIHPGSISLRDHRQLGVVHLSVPKRGYVTIPLGGLVSFAAVLTGLAVAS